MIRLIGLWLVVCAMCVTPVAADEDVYDGPTAIKPLTVTRQPQHSAPPNTVCDFEHQCYPEKPLPGTRWRVPMRSARNSFTAISAGRATVGRQGIPLSARLRTGLSLRPRPTMCHEGRPSNAGRRPRNRDKIGRRACTVFQALA
jgi:hypothetical protein